jgi:hypothetical protein
MRNSDCKKTEGKNKSLTGRRQKIKNSRKDTVVSFTINYNINLKTIGAG